MTKRELLENAEGGIAPDDWLPDDLDRLEVLGLIEIHHPGYEYTVRGSVRIPPVAARISDWGREVLALYRQADAAKVLAREIAVEALGSQSTEPLSDEQLGVIAAHVETGPHNSVEFCGLTKVEAIALLAEIRRLQPLAEAGAALGVLEEAVSGPFGWAIQGGGHPPATYFAAMRMVPEAMVTGPTLLALAEAIRERSR